MAVTVKYTGNAKKRDEQESYRPTVKYVGTSTVGTAQNTVKPETTVSAPETGKKREKTVLSPGGTFLGGMSYRGTKLKEKTDAEKAEEARQQAEYLKEYQRLLSIDTEALSKEVDAAKRDNSRPKYQVNALSGYDSTRKTDEQKMYASKLSDLNKAKTIQYEANGAEALGKLSAADGAAVETLATERQDSAARQAAWQTLQQSGYTDDEISQLINYQRNIPKRQKNAEIYSEIQDAAAAYAETNPGLATLASVPANLVSGIGTADAAMSRLSDPNSPTDYKSAAMLPYAFSSTARGTVSENLERKHGKAASFLYGVGTSIADSAATAGLALVGVPAGLASATLGGAAATDAMVQAKERGLSDDEAIMNGVAAGVFETLFEKVSLDSLITMNAPTGSFKQKVAGTLKNALKQAGIEGSEELATSAANLFFDHVAHGQMSDAQQRIYAYMAQGMDYTDAKNEVEYEILLSMAEDFAAGALSGGLMGGGGSAVQALSTPTEARQKSREKAHIKGEYKASETGKTTYKGKEVSVDGVDAEGNVVLSSGESVKGNEVEYADRKTAEVYEGLNGSETIPTAARGAIARAYEGKQESDEFVHGMEEAYRAGAYGIPMEDMTRNGFNAELTDTQKKLAYDLGAGMRKEQSEQKAALSNGGIVYEDGIDRKKLTNIQKDSIKVAEAISKAVGGKVHLYSTTQNAKGIRTADQQSVRALIGEDKAPNGFYDHKTGDIYLDINSGTNGEGTMLYTLAHEYTHMMHQNAKESFDKLTELLFQKYRENGDDVDALILAKQERLGVDYDTAFEEFVADSMEAMLTDTNAAERIAGLKETDKTAWEKLKELVHKLLESIRGLYEQYSPSSTEGRRVREMGDALEKLSDLFVEGLSAVGKKSSPVQDAGQSRQRVGGPVTPLGVSATQESNTTIPQERRKSKPKRTALDKILDKAKNGRVDPQKAMEEMGGKSFSKALDSGLYALDAKDMLYRVNPDEHIDNRENWDVGERRLKAFQYDHPEIHPYFAQAAGDLLDELSLSERGGEVYKKTGRGVGDDVYLRTKRLATDRIAYLLDDQSLTYDDIERALNAIVADDGQENFAAAKRVELLLDKMLTEGYTTPYGQTFAPNAEYIQLKQKIPGAEAEQGTSEGKISYSIREIRDNSGKSYGIGVYLDSTLLENLTDAERVQMVRERVKELGGQTFTAYDASGNSIDVMIAEPNKKFVNKSGKTVPVNKDLLTKNRNSKIKQEAVVLADELIEAASYGDKVPAKYSHDWLDNYGRNDWQYWKTYIQDKNKTVWIATLNIAESKNGEKVLYDITNIKKAGQSVESDTSTASNNIPQQTPIVKKRFSMQERYRPEDYTEDEKKQHVADAKAFFGKTYKWSETGYVTVDGTKLDFSGRHEGGPGGYRTVDHRDIRDALGEDYGGEDYSGAMVQFMAEGNIRISPESGGINLSVMPTKAQMATLSDFISRERGEVIIDIDDTSGNTVSSTEYPRGTHSSRIVNDINAYFENGTVPQVSELSRFRYQERGTSNREILTTALESAAQNPREREVLAEYKAAADKLETYEARLRENRAKLQELTVDSEKQNAKRISKLKSEIRQDENRVNIVTGQLETMENRESLRALLAREREAIVIQQKERVRQLQERLNEYREKYGTFPGGEKAAREILLPRKSGDGEKISQTVRTILEASATPEEAIPTIEEMALDGRFSYETYSDKESIADAESEIKRVGWAQSLSSWMSSIEKGNVSKQNTAMGWALYNNAANSGDTNTALDILSHMVEHQRSAAQALQATRILKEMSPTTQLYQVQRSVENLQAELNKRFGEKKAPALKVDTELAEQFMSATDQEGRDAAMRSIYRDIGKQMPSKFIDKWNAWRYLAMLGNARTHVRNVVGNAGFVPVVATKDVIATGIESAVHRLSGGRTERTKSFVSGKGGKALLAAAVKDYAKIQDVAMGGGKYSEFANANKYIEEGRVIFKSNVPGLKQASKALEKARRTNSNALDREDVWFSKPHYAYAMAQYCKANGITAEMIESGRGDAIAKARDYAINEAQKATYRDTNSFSQAISELGRVRYGSKSGTKKAISTIMEGILPFRKTPANILVRGVEYSPLGLMNGIKKAVFDVHKGNATSAEAIDAISAGLTGTGLLMFGIYLAAEGVVRGHGDDEEKENTFAELTGHQAYALELPDGTSVTLDWLAPECLPFFIGVNLWELTEGGTDILTMADALNAVSQVSEPLLEMSCLQSLDAIFDTVGYAKSNDTPALVGALASAGTSYLTQALPTLLGQAERTSEDIRYTTYTDPNSPLTSDMQYTLGKASARIPGVDYSQIPYIDAWGRRESTGNTLERFINNFLNPAYTSDINESDMEKELLRVYESTGDASVFPSRAKKSIRSNGNDVKLTGEQYVEFAEKQGGNAYKWMNELVNRSEFKKLSDVEKASCIGLIYQAARETASGDIVSGYEKSSWVADALSSGNIVEAAIIKTKYPDAKASAFEAYKEYGSSIGRDTFLEAYGALSEMTGEDYDGDGRSDAYSKIDKKLAYIDKLALTNEQKRALAIAADISEKNIDKRAPWS